MYENPHVRPLRGTNMGHPRSESKSISTSERSVATRCGAGPPVSWSRLFEISDVRGLKMGNCDLIVFFEDDCELAGVIFYFCVVADGGAADLGGEDAD